NEKHNQSDHLWQEKHKASTKLTAARLKILLPWKVQRETFIGQSGAGMQPSPHLFFYSPCHSPAFINFLILFYWLRKNRERVELFTTVAHKTLHPPAMAATDPNKVRKQVEFYFGDSNFPRDKFLRAQAALNEEGCKTHTSQHN